MKSGSGKSTLFVLDAGGGAGRQNINFETLAAGQSTMYERTLNQLSDFQMAHLAQEKRQLTVVDPPISMYINVSREDFPDVTARIDIVYVKSASSQAWANLLKDVCTKLKIDFIHSILDRVDKSPVHRILRLRPGGDYLARQRETSAILEVINTGKTPVDVSWDITMDINDVKNNLTLDQRSMPVIDRRVANLVSKPVTRETQREIATLIMNAVSPKAAVGVIEQFHKQYIGVTTDDGQPPDADDATLSLGDVAKYGDAIDIVTLHRLCLETLGRFVTQGRAKHVASTPCFEYVCNVIDGLRSEVDVVTIGLKLLTDVMKYLVEERETVFHVILNCVQAYAPPAAPHRPRDPKRLLPPEEQMAANFETPSFPTASRMVKMGEREAVMPAVPPSLQRYGDFYGCSAPPDAGGVEKLSADIKKVDDVLGRFEKDKALIPSVEAIEPLTSAARNTKLGQPIVHGGATDVMALVRGRVRIDHSAASHAIQSAFHAPVSSPAPTSSAVKSLPRQAEVVIDVDASDEFVRQQNDFAEMTKSARRAKYQFKFKVKSKEGSDGEGGETGDGEKERKKWKGTQGVIGRFEFSR